MMGRECIISVSLPHMGCHKDHTEYAIRMLAQGMQSPKVDTARLYVMEKVSQKPKEAVLSDHRQNILQ